MNASQIGSALNRVQPSPAEDVGAVDDLGVAGVGECVGLADLRRFGDTDREIALGDGHGGDSHVLAHDDDAGGLVDDHTGRLIGAHAQLLDVGHQGDDVAVVAGR